MTNEKNGYIWSKRIMYATGAILGIGAIMGIVGSIILNVYIFPVTASKEALSTVEVHIKEKLVTKEVFDLTLKQYEKEMANLKDAQNAMNKKLDALILMLTNRGGGAGTPN